MNARLFCLSIVGMILGFQFSAHALPKLGGSHDDHKHEEQPGQLVLEEIKHNPEACPDLNGRFRMPEQGLNDVYYRLSTGQNKFGEPTITMTYEGVTKESAERGPEQKLVLPPDVSADDLPDKDGLEEAGSNQPETIVLNDLPVMNEDGSYDRSVCADGRISTLTYNPEGTLTKIDSQSLNSDGNLQINFEELHMVPLMSIGYPEEFADKTHQ